MASEPRVKRHMANMRRRDSESTPTRHELKNIILTLRAHIQELQSKFSELQAEIKTTKTREPEHPRPGSKPGESEGFYSTSEGREILDELDNLDVLIKGKELATEQLKAETRSLLDTLEAKRVS